MENINDLMQWKINEMYFGLCYKAKNNHVFEAILAHYYPPNGLIYVDEEITNNCAKVFKDKVYNRYIIHGEVPITSDVCPYCMVYLSPNYEKVYMCEYGRMFNFCTENESHWSKCEKMFQSILF